MSKKFSEKLEEFRKNWFNYMWQSAAATATIFCALIFIGIEESPIIIASIGASAFVVFAMPDHITARISHLAGGHLTGIAAGALCSLIPDTGLLSIGANAAAVGIALFIMVVIDFEHPPACGTALAMANKSPERVPAAAAAVAISIAVLVIARLLLKKRLKNLV